MKSYKAVQLGICLLLVAYFVAGISFRFIDSVQVEQEIFPVFSWNLFSDVPEVENRMFKVEITEDTSEGASVPYAFLDREQVSDKHYHLISALGHAVVSEDSRYIEIYTSRLHSLMGDGVREYRISQKSPSGDKVLAEFSRNK